MFHEIKEFIQSKKTIREASSSKSRKQLRIYQESFTELKNADKARKQQETLSIQSKKTTHILSRTYYKIKEFIQSKKTTRETFSFKARKQHRIYQERITKLK